jgi:pyruvyl transferase EpsO
MHGPSLRTLIEERLAPHVDLGARIAFVHFPSHRNPGDAAIALGAFAVLKRLGTEVSYVCSRESYDPELLRRRIGDGPVFLNGGGSFGDHYAWEQAFREQVLDDFAGNPVVQLPQSMNFRSGVALESARRALNAHPRFTLFLRDRGSYETALDAFDVPAILCPDLAFAWTPPADQRRPNGRILCLGRLDSESLGQIHRIRGPELVHTDWPYAPVDALRWPLRRALSRYARQERERWVRRTIDVTSRQVLPRLAEQTLANACRHLRRYDVVITDRLHGHVLCTLLDIPHVVLDDRNSKVRDFYETWSSDDPLSAFAKAPDEALDLARSMREGS